MAAFVTILRSFQCTIAKSSPVVPTVIMLLSVLLLTFRCWGRFEAAGKCHDDIFEKLSKITPVLTEVRGKKKLQSRRSTRDGWDGRVRREVRLLQNDSADRDTDPLMQLNIFRPTFHV